MLTIIITIVIIAASLIIIEAPGVIDMLRVSAACEDTLRVLDCSITGLLESRKISKEEGRRVYLAHRKEAIKRQEIEMWSEMINNPDAWVEEMVKSNGARVLPFVDAMRNR